MSVYFTVILGLVSLVSLLPPVPARADENGNDPMIVARYSDSPGIPRTKLNFRTEISEKYEYYDVSGADAAEIRRQMSRNGTKWDDGETYDALTTWEIKYRYDTARDSGSCYVNSARTNVGITFRYPRWTPPAGTPESVKAQWNTYMNHLITHEIGHKDLAVKTAREISNSLSAMGAFESCGALDEAASKIAREHLARLKEVQIEYDATTRHGATQGAVFP